MENQRQVDSHVDFLKDAPVTIRARLEMSMCTLETNGASQDTGKLRGVLAVE